MNLDELLSICLSIIIIIILIWILYRYKDIKRNSIPDNEIIISDDLNTLYERRAEKQRTIFLTEAFLKLIPPVILSISISILYVASQSISYFDIHIKVYLMIIILILCILWYILYIKSGKWYKEIAPFNSKIKSIEQHDTTIISQNLTRKAEELKKNIEREEINKEWKKHTEKIEKKLISELKKTLKDLKAENEKEKYALEFIRKSNSREIRNSTNSELLSLIEEFSSLIDLNEEVIFQRLTDGIKSLVIETTNREHFRLIGDAIRNNYINLLIQIRDLPLDKRLELLKKGYIDNFLQTILNICNKEQFDIFLDIYTDIPKGIPQIDTFVEHGFASCFIVKNEKHCKTRLRQLWKTANNYYYDKMYYKIDDYVDIDSMRYATGFPKCCNPHNMDSD